MPEVENQKPYYKKDRVEQAINKFASIKNPKVADLEAVGNLAQVESQLDRYRSATKNMTIDQLEDEEHQSKRLAEYLTISGDPKPHKNCHAHAIISGSHKDAARLRAVLAWVKIRIDDPDNGCWLPENTAALSLMPRRLRHAIPHSRIHRFNYYHWLNSIINLRATRTDEQLRSVLKMVETRIQAGSQPSYVMNKKGVGLPV
ncbi:AHH domain-containing protein [Endozoicomonas arenosclerae]|uniref:AHH domain-containing protein n=1 Tax=Endozoicomonas arenosclerae TaxID=1633495 RepID=UPI0007831292|nr:AHH domain-containing protein [Endozoicomonas arenosclerae]